MNFRNLSHEDLYIRLRASGLDHTTSFWVADDILTDRYWDRTVHVLQRVQRLGGNPQIMVTYDRY